MIRAACAALAIALGASAAVAAPCRQALVLGLDVSGSVDAQEYRLQLDGLAAALRHPDVVRALLSMPSAPVRLAVFEWSSTDYQRRLVDWTELAGAGDIAAVAQRLAGTARAAAPPGTALGTAMRHGADLLAQAPDCWKRTLDVSSDGRRNVGPQPRDVRAALAGRGLTVNALVIGADAPRGGGARQAEIGALSAYFRAWVITGPGAFVETALGFETYEAAMVRKLLRELQAPSLAGLLPAGRAGQVPESHAPPRRHAID